MTETELQERLARFLESAGGQPVRIEGLKRLPGGASRETWSFDLVTEEGGRTVRRALVLRRDPPSAAMTSDRRQEFLVLRAARAAGVPVPRVHWLGEDPTILGARFLIMERIAGETLGRRLLRDPEYARARAVMVEEFGRILARIHAIDWERAGLGGLPHPAPDESPARAELRRYEQLFRLVSPEPHPAFELAFRWLWERLPPPAAWRLVHGDFRVGNVMFGPDGTRAVLDWELAHLGDPMEDLGWLCVRSWRFGQDDRPVGGLGAREELFRAYEAAGGERVDPERVRFWEVFGNLKWGVICIGQARTFLEGHSRNIELAALGRRTAEVELELLNLISGT